MVLSLRTAAAIASALMLVACAAEVVDAPAAIEEPEPAQALSDDAGALAADVDEPADELPSVSVECTGGFDPFICDGGCPAGQGCCVTGLRPLGFCTSLEECPVRCAIDCAEVGLSRSAHEGAHCLSLCTWLSPEPACTPAL